MESSPLKKSCSPPMVNIQDNDDVVFLSEHAHEKEWPKNIASSPSDSSREISPTLPISAPAALKYRSGGAIIQRDFSSLFKAAHRVPREGDFGIDATVKLLLQPEYNGCLESCMCKIQLKSPRARAPIKEVISHRWHGGKLFLLCKHHPSQNAVPEYLRLCQVNDIQRQQYARYLSFHQQPPPMKEKWTKEQEDDVRAALYREVKLTAKQAQTQEEIRVCKDTAVWMKDTCNGTVKLAKKVVAAPKKVQPIANRPGPIFEADRAFYEVEKIVGRAKNPKGQRIYWVKWVGWPVSECSWETEQNLQMSTESIAAFNAQYGEPTADRPVVYSPEGRRYCETLAGRDKPK